MAPRLIEAIQELYLRYPVPDTLRYLAAARQGLGADLLHHLEPDWSVETCKERLGEMKPLSFVKTRPGTEFVFLHDEMYELCEEHLLRGSEVQGMSHRLVAWYDKQIGEGSDVEQRQDLQVDSLLYRLRAGPRLATTGIQWWSTRQTCVQRWALPCGCETRCCCPALRPRYEMCEASAKRL